MKFTLKNESDSNVEILKWGTPFEGKFTSDCFDVQNDGEQILYVGMLVKRGAPQAVDFINIGANEEISEILKLENGYEIYKAGAYTVRYREDAIRVKAELASQKEDAEVEFFLTQMTSTHSNEAVFVVNSGLSEPAKSGHPLAVFACNGNQMATINSALNAARSISSNARSALRNAPVAQRPNAQRYREWFGAYTSSRYSTVIGQADRIHDALANKQIYVACSDINAYAYVYPDKPYVVYFGMQFWNAPLNGTDSKAGTFVHEMSHFYVVAGTRDHVYGQRGARNLANSNPDRAINNADNNEYFAESNPHLSMPTAPPSGGGDDDDGDSSGCFIQSIGKL